jgi:hypothetical protein
MDMEMEMGDGSGSALASMNGVTSLWRLLPFYLYRDSSRLRFLGSSYAITMVAPSQKLFVSIRRSRRPMVWLHIACVCDRTTAH